ncbi:MAG: DUF2079 domain-containing protein [Polyangiaceae bacterium]|nr:DUF2079 domain-containing protein [Polyangiaceae bacterium]
MTTLDPTDAIPPPPPGGPARRGPAALTAAPLAPPATAASLAAPATALGLDPTAPTPPLTRMAVAALMLVAIGASLGLTAALLRVDDFASLATRNVVAPLLRRRFVLAAAVGGGAAVVSAAIVLLSRPTGATLDRVERVARLGAPLALLFPLPIFFDWRVFNGRELLCVASVSAYALLLERAFRSFYRALPVEALAAFATRARIARPAAARWWPRLVLGALVVGFGAYFSYYTIQNHKNLLTTSWDLAIFDNMMWNLVRGKWFKASPDLGRTGSHIQYHATFLAYLFAPFYALRQKADTLLALQAILAGAGAIPLYLLARLRLASAVGALVLVYAYLVHAPLHQPIFYDFHFLTTSPFWVGWTLYFFETRRRGPLLALFACTLLLREDQSACLAAAFLFYLLSGERPGLAIAGGLSAAAYFVLCKFVVMPLHASGGGSSESFTWMYKDLIPPGGHGFGAVLQTVVTNPIYLTQTLLVVEKFQYVGKMFAPTLFLTLRHPYAWVLHVPPAIFTLLSSGYEPLYQTYFQYSSNWTAYLFFGAAAVLGSWRLRPGGHVRVAAALSSIAVTATIMSYHHGAIFQHHTFRGGFTHPRFVHTAADERNLSDLYELIAMIPPNASVAATEREAPHVSNREDCFTMRFSYDDADYLLLSIAEGRSSTSRKNLQDAVNSKQYGFIAQRGEFALWGRGAPQDKNAEGRRIFGLSDDPATSPAPSMTGTAPPLSPLLLKAPPPRVPTDATGGAGAAAGTGTGATKSPPAGSAP